MLLIGCCSVLRRIRREFLKNHRCPPPPGDSDGQSSPGQVHSIFSPTTSSPVHHKAHPPAGPAHMSPSTFQQIHPLPAASSITALDQKGYLQIRWSEAAAFIYKESPCASRRGIQVLSTEAACDHHIKFLYPMSRGAGMGEERSTPGSDAREFGHWY